MDRIKSIAKKIKTFLTMTPADIVELFKKNRTISVDNGWDSQENQNVCLEFDSTENCITFSNTTADRFWIDEASNLFNFAHYDYVMHLSGGQEIRIVSIDDINNGVDILYDPNHIAVNNTQGRLTLRINNDWDTEENNASQDNRAHEESNENRAYSSENMLQLGHAIHYTQQPGREWSIS